MPAKFSARWRQVRERRKLYPLILPWDRKASPEFVKCSVRETLGQLAEPEEQMRTLAASSVVAHARSRQIVSQRPQGITGLLI